MSKRDFRQIYFYEFQLGRSAAETARNINTVWGERSVNECTVQRWYQKFRAGNISLEDEPHGSRPPAIDDDQMKALIEADPLKTTREVAKELRVDHSTVVRHLKVMGKVKKLDKWVPHELNEIQKNRRFEVSSALLLRNKFDPFLNRIVTSDEKWLLYDNRRRSAQWLDHDETPRQFPKPNLHKKKVMVTVWWCAAGVIHHSFLNPGETITAEKYCQQIQEMHTKLQHMCPALVNRKGPILLHDNARPHVSIITRQKLHDLNYETLDHPPYSPDLSPTDYHFFKHLDNFVRHKCFKTQRDAEQAFDDFIASRTEDFFANGINKLVSRWQRCIHANGCYF